MMTKTDYMKDMRNMSFSKNVLQRVAGAAVVLLMICLVLAVPAAADNLSPTLRVLSVQDDTLVSIDGASISDNKPIIFVVDIPANADIFTDYNGNTYNLDLVSTSASVNNISGFLTFSTWVSPSYGHSEYFSWGDATSFDYGEYTVCIEYLKSDGTIGYSNTVSFSILPTAGGGSSLDHYIALSGSGTESNPYLIQSPSDLKLLSDEVKSGKKYKNTYFAITNNLDLSAYSDWQPIGDLTFSDSYLVDSASPYDGGIYWGSSSQNIFCGKVDGRGHTISGLTTTGVSGDYGNFDFTGLFGVVGPGTVLKNIKLSGVDISSGSYHYIGGLIGGIYGYDSYGSDAIIIDNCHVDGNVYGNGGLIGRAYSEAAPITISKCSAHVFGDIWGGLIGQIDTYSASADITISECFVTLKDGVAVDGGFAGDISAVEGTVRVKDCYVSGAFGNQCIAGLFSIVRADSASSVIIERCYSGATVSSGYNTGGLIGSMDAVDKYSEYAPSIPSIPGTLTVTDSVYLGWSICGDYSDKIVGAVYREDGSGEIILDELYAREDAALNSAYINEYGYTGNSVSSDNLLTQTFYEDTLGWDFDSVWMMDSEISPYPVFIWQTTTQVSPPASGIPGGASVPPYLFTVETNNISANVGEVVSIPVTFSYSGDKLLSLLISVDNTNSNANILINGSDLEVNEEYSCAFNSAVSNDYQDFSLITENGLHDNCILFFLDVTPVAHDFIIPINISVTELFDVNGKSRISECYCENGIVTVRTNTPESLPGTFSIISPENASILNANEPVQISWSSASGSTGYKFALRDITSGEGEKLIDNLDLGNVQSYTIPASLLTPGYAYRFAVCAYNDVGENWVESTFSYYPDSCIISFDANGGTGSLSPIFGSSGKSYILPECTFTAPAGEEFKAWLIGSAEYQPGDYYTPSASVTAKALWVDAVGAPGEFAVICPGAGSLISSTDSFTVNWTAASGALGYTFSLRDRTISETEDAGKLINNEDIGNVLNYTIPSDYLISGHDYRLAVCAYNDAGEVWEEVEFSINTQALLAGIPIMQSPSASGTYYTGNNITVTWTAPDTNPDSYTIWLYGGGNDAVVFEGITGNTYTISGSNFTNAGSYSVDVYAIKKGYLQDNPGNVLFEVVGEPCIHVNTSEVDVKSYLGVSKSFPMCDGDQHYWYVNKVCTDCGEVLQSNVKKYASHNSIVNGDIPGVCECNYYPTEWIRSKRAYMNEDRDTYLIPEVNPAYKGGSLNKGEECFILSAENIGGYKDWNLIEYAVSGTDRTKIRFVKTDVVCSHPNIRECNYVYDNVSEAFPMDSEDGTHYWYVDVCDLCGKVFDKSVEYHEQHNSSNGLCACNYHEFETTIGKMISVKMNTQTYTHIDTESIDDTILQTIPVLLIANNIGDKHEWSLIEYLDENTDRYKIRYVMSTSLDDKFVYSDDTWQFKNHQDSFSSYLDYNGDSTKPKYYVKEEDWKSVFGWTLADQVTYATNREWGGNCAAMVAMIIGVENNIFPIAGFLGPEDYHTCLHDFFVQDLQKTHNLFNSEKVQSLGQYLGQLQIYFVSSDLQLKKIENGVNNYETILDEVNNGNLIFISMNKLNLLNTNAGGHHALLGYAVETLTTDNGDTITRLFVYDPNTPNDVSGYMPYIEFTYNKNKISGWEYKHTYGRFGQDAGETVYGSNTHLMLYYSEDDILTCLNNFNNLGESTAELKSDNELIYITQCVGNSDLLLLTDYDNARKIVVEADVLTTSESATYIIPNGEVQLSSPNGGTAIVSDTHSSIEVTLGEGTTASLFVDDDSENCVEIKSDDENKNHAFTVTYGYDSSAGKGYQETIVNGTMSSSFKCEETENGLKLTGLESADIVIRDGNGKSAIVSKLTDTSDYDEMVVTVDDTVTVSGTCGDESIVITSVPLTPEDSSDSSIREILNTTSSVNAVTKAEIGYSLPVSSLSELRAPTFTCGSLSTVLDEKVTVIKCVKGAEILVDAFVNDDGSVKITGDVSDAESLTVSFMGRKLGDVTNEGKVDTLDAARVLQASVGLYAFSNADTFYGDVSGDGLANTLDAARILQYSVSLVDENYVAKA